MATTPGRLPEVEPHGRAAPCCSYAGGCPDSEISQGIRYAADNGAKVINLSLGGSEPSETMRDALKYAVGKGAFVAIAMGNEYEEGNPVGYGLVQPRAALRGFGVAK